MTIGVSDHAIVRYLERVGGFDIARLRSEIAARCAPAAKAGASCVTIDGHLYMIRSDETGRPVVTTVMPPETPKQQRRRGR